jgi:hypothetical protein
MAVDNVAVCDNDTGNADLNCDCTVNFIDYAILMQDWGVECNDIYAKCLMGTDLDDSNSIDYGDLNIMLDYWLAGEKLEHNRIDLNDDGKIDLKDYSSFADSYRERDAAYDYNEDGIVDTVDLSIFAEHWFEGE